MRSMPLAALVATLALLSAQRDALAQPADGVSLRGLYLGTALPDMRECRHDAIAGRKYYRQSMEPGDPLCWMDKQESEVLVQATGTRRITVSGLPFIKGAGSSAEVALLDGAIAAIGVRFLATYADDFRVALEDKFGRPSSSEQVTYTNRFGARSVGYRLVWLYPDSTITAEQFDGTTEWGAVWTRTKAYDAALKESSNAARKAIGGRL